MHGKMKLRIVVLHRTKELVHAPVPVAPLFWLPPIYQNLVVDKAFACHFLGLLQSHDVKNGRSHVG